MRQLFIKGIRLNRNLVEDFDEYPFNIPIIKNLKEIRFEKPVTFIMGENGSGKSTIIEAIAISIGLSAEGGTRNMVYETFNSTSTLDRYLTIKNRGFTRNGNTFYARKHFILWRRLFQNMMTITRVFLTSRTAKHSTRYFPVFRQTAYI